MFCEMIPNTAIPSSRYPSGLLYRLNSDSSGSSLSPFLLDPEALEDPASCSASEKAAWRPYGPGLGSPTVVVSPAGATTTMDYRVHNPAIVARNMYWKMVKIWQLTKHTPSRRPPPHAVLTCGWIPIIEQPRGLVHYLVPRMGLSDAGTGAVACNKVRVKELVCDVYH